MTFCDLSRPSNRSGLVSFFGSAALAAVVLGAIASSTDAVGLTYVDGQPGSSFGETANLFRSDGSSLGTPGAVDVFTSETNIDDDNAWGWRDFGATNLTYRDAFLPETYASVYESTGNEGAEDSSEFQMRIGSGEGVAASTAYDVYIAYWSDIGGNWGIRAGLQPGTEGTPLPAFGNFNSAVADETPGIFASSGAWDVLPLDNPTDENMDPLVPTDSNINPFLDVTPGSPANSARNMLLGFLGTVTSGTQPNTSSSQIRVWVDDLPAGAGGAGRRSWFDGVVFAPAGSQVFWSAEVDRNTGNVLVHNDTDNDFTVVSYSITSAAGSLDGDGVNNEPWNNLSANTIPNYSDDDDDWSVVAPAEFATELREDDGGVLAGSGMQDGIVVPANDGIQLDLGNVWRQLPFEDLRVQLRLADGTPETFDDNPTVLLIPTFSGDVAVRGDFNGDRAIDVLDYIALMQNLHLPQGELVRAEYYSHGDFNDSNAVDRDDFFLFRSAYFQANPGAGAAGFAAMAAEAAAILGRGVVPEPSTLLLAMLGGGFLCGRSRRRARGRVQHFNSVSASMNSCEHTFPSLTSAVLSLIAASVLVSGARAVPVVDWQCDSLSGNCDPSQIFDGGTNSPTIGDGTAEAADDFGVWGATPTNVHLDSSLQAILSGRIRFIAGETGGGANGRDFRWGMWKKVENGAPDAEGAWLGYMAEGGSGGTPGRLQARNPDDPGFSTASFLSDFGGGSIATTVGPAPTAGSPLDDFNNVGAGTGRYFLLAEPPVTNSAAFVTGAPGEEVWYKFEIRVGAFGNEVDVSGSLVAETQPAIGDYNNNGTTDAADYTVWRDALGTAAVLPNRDPANMGNVSQADYDSWVANFGSTSAGTPFELRLGGGLDFDGRPPAALDDMDMPVPFTSHLTFDFDRVGFLFGNQMDMDQVLLEDVDISTEPIETVDLFIDTATGEVQMRNLIETPFDIDYYEITSTNAVLEFDNWESFDEADGGLPVTNDNLTGWDIAGGSSDSVLSEGNFVGSTTIAMGSPIDMGTIFKTATLEEDRDIRFFVGLVGGGVMRGTVTYGTAGGASLTAVPEPATAGLLWCGAAIWGLGRRRRRRAAP